MSLGEKEHDPFYLKPMMISFTLVLLKFLATVQNILKGNICPKIVTFIVAFAADLGIAKVRTIFSGQFLEKLTFIVKRNIYKCLDVLT